MIRKIDVSFIILVFQIIFTETHNIKFDDDYSKGINSKCNLTNNEGNGICMRIEDCHLEIRNSSKASLQTCYFDGSTPVICCPQNKSKSDIPTTKKPESFYYDIIDEKCEEIYDDVIDITPCIGLGGHPIDDGEYSFMAAIGWKIGENIEFKCGGFLIEENYVITSAHCIRTSPNIVRLGGLKLTNNTITPDDIMVSNVYIHPEYIPTQSYNDIAILELASNANVINSKPACLWHLEHLHDYNKLLSVGFNISSFDNLSSDPIKKVNLTLHENEVCQSKYEEDNKLPHGTVKSHLCAGNIDADEASCPGDSGGPIGIKRWNACFNAIPVPFVIGLTSFGQGCGSDSPMVFTRMTSYLEWIVSIVWPEYL